MFKWFLYYRLLQEMQPDVLLQKVSQWSQARTKASDHRPALKPFQRRTKLLYPAAQRKSKKNSQDVAVVNAEIGGCLSVMVIPSHQKAELPATNPANTRRSPLVGSMSGQCYRQYNSFESTFGKRLVLLGDIMLISWESQVNDNIFHDISFKAEINIYIIILLSILCNPCFGPCW